MRYERQNLCIDFDGVIAHATKWEGRYVFGEPIEGAETFLKLASDRFRIVILTARPDIKDVWEWLYAHDLGLLIDDVTNVKPPAFAYIDDKAINFNGRFVEAWGELMAFKTWHEEQT